MTRTLYETNTPSKRKVADWYNGTDIDDDMMRDILSLVGEEHDVSGWTNEQRRHAANWAMREHFRASDNRNLCLPRPAWLSDH